MSKLSALILVALFLGGAGTGMGGVLLYQFATGTLIGAEGPQGPEGDQGIPGLPGTNGTDGTDGASGPQQLNGIYEGDHVFATSIIPKNATVIFRNGNFYGDNIYIYGNLTIENAVLYLRIWPFGNATVILNKTQWDLPSSVIYTSDNASLLFLNGFDAAESAYPTSFRLVCWDSSKVSFINCSSLYGKLYSHDQTEVHIMNIPAFSIQCYAYQSSMISLQDLKTLSEFFVYDNATVYAWNTIFADDVYAYQMASVFTNDSLIDGNYIFEFNDNSSYTGWNTSGPGLNRIDGKDNATAELWNCSIHYVWFYENSTVLISTNSYIPDLYLWDSAIATLRVSSTINLLEAHQVSITYFYLSESCAINTQNLFDAAQVITL